MGGGILTTARAKRPVASRIHYGFFSRDRTDFGGGSSTQIGRRAQHEYWKRGGRWAALLSGGSGVGDRLTHLASVSLMLQEARRRGRALTWNAGCRQHVARWTTGRTRNRLSSVCVWGVSGEYGMGSTPDRDGQRSR